MSVCPWKWRPFACMSVSAPGAHKAGGEGEDRIQLVGEADLLGAAEVAHQRVFE